jgi:hypothetical protein
MDSRRAKDFLVGEAARQAEIEGIPLSDLEKRMMYFTEGPDAVENPIQLNEDFEAAYDGYEYEGKISQLLKHARARLKSQSAAELETWKHAVATLREGDHYLSVMVGGMGWIVPAKLSIRILAPFVCLIVVVVAFRRWYGPLPRVSPYFFFALLVAFYLASIWWSRRKGEGPMNGFLKLVIKYLFGKW